MRKMKPKRAKNATVMDRLAAVKRRSENKATSSEQLRVLVEAMLHHYDWKLWMELCVLALRDTAAAAERDRLDRRWRAALRSAIRDGQESGEFIASDPDETMFVLAALLDGNPGLGTPSSGDRRTYPFRKYPYSVIYKPDDTGIRILVVRHQRRQPGYGSARG